MKRSHSSSSCKSGLSGRYPSIVIYGPIDSGKTVLFYHLYSSQFQQTQSSMNENVLEFKPNGFEKCQTYQFVDFPGHGINVSKYVFEKHHNKGMKAMIFCVDISDTRSAIEGAKFSVYCKYLFCFGLFCLLRFVLL